MTLRLDTRGDETLARLAKRFGVSKNSAAATAIESAAPRADHRAFVTAATDRLMQRYSDLLHRLAEV